MRKPAIPGARVIDVQDDLIKVDRLGSSDISERVAVLVGYKEDTSVTRSDRRYIEAFIASGYRVIFVRATDGPKVDVDWGALGPIEGVSSIVRSNFGYDFGSWAVAIREFPQLVYAKHVILSNDSIVGPFADFGPLARRFEAATADVWSATINNQHFPHLQSFFLGFNHQVLSDSPLREFWREVRIEREKDDVIEKYELGLSRLLFAEAYVTDCAYPSQIVLDYDMNPSVIGWERLMDLGFPFVKKMVLEQPHLAWDGERAPGYVQRTFGEDVWEWLES